MRRSLLTAPAIALAIAGLITACSSSPASPADLSSTLPAQIGGQTLTVTSQTGEEYVSENDDFRAVLTTLGKQPADVSVATATHATAESQIFVFAFRVAGVDANRLLDVIKTKIAAEQPGSVIGTATIGGKGVTTYGSGEQNFYLYTRGDVLYEFFASDEAAATEIATKLP